MSSPSLVWVTEAGTLAIADVPSVGGYRGRRAALQPKHTLPLARLESVLDVRCIHFYIGWSPSALSQLWYLQYSRFSPSAPCCFTTFATLT